jgi:hypothetical protein
MLFRDYQPVRVSDIYNASSTSPRERGVEFTIRVNN